MTSVPSPYHQSLRGVGWLKAVTLFAVFCCAQTAARGWQTEDSGFIIQTVAQQEELLPPIDAQENPSLLSPPAEKIVEPSQPDLNLIRQRAAALIPQLLPPAENSESRASETPCSRITSGAGLPLQAATAVPPDLPSEVTVQIQKPALPDDTTVDADGNNVTLIAREAPLSAILNSLAEQMSLNVVSAGSVSGQVSITLNQVPLEDALDAILSVNGYRWVRQKNIIMISAISSETKLPPQVQGRELRVFRLNYASAADIDKTIKALLSPVGQSNVTEVDMEDKRRTREEIVVEDLPEYLDRIQVYIQQADQPPAQVLIEAYVLQVNLRDDNRHGVELENLASLTGGELSVTANGIADPTASPAFILNLNGRRLDAIVELIKQTTDAKTLASPKVLAVNGQEARIQIGERLGYLTTTTTQTSTLQQVNFLDLGVVLTATPVISNDGRILMSVKPEVSSGQINPTTGLPDSDTTEVESTVLMPSGHAMVIGGLITEDVSDQQSKVPYIGDIPGLGKLFQRRRKLKVRSEIIIALQPRIVPYGELAQFQHANEVKRATSPVLYGPLIESDRRALEAELPNANRVCDELGRPICDFPSARVAYSPYDAGFVTLPDIGPQIQSIAPSGPPVYKPQTEVITPPPAEIQTGPVIQQMVYERPAPTSASAPRRGNMFGTRRHPSGQSLLDRTRSFFRRSTR